MPPLVSIVMPVYNGMPHLPETLSAVEAQTHRRLQCIAVNDGASDGSRACLERNGRWTVQQCDRLGPNRARNLALAQAEGDFVAFLDQDDIWHPDHLTDCVLALARCTSSAAAVARRQTFRTSSDLRLGRALPDIGTLDPWATFPINIIDSPSQVVIRRDALSRIGGWPTDRNLGADPLTWWRLSATAPLVVCPRLTTGIRQSADSYSAAARKKPLEYLDALHRAARDALEAIPERARLGVNELADRLMNSVGEIVGSALSGGDLVPAARRLEEALSARKVPILIVTIGFLGWLLRPAIAAEEEMEASQTRVLAKLISEWPSDASRTRAVVLRMAGATAPGRVAALFCGDPWRRGAQTALLAGILFKTAQILGRIDDPLALEFGAASWRS